MKKRLVLGLLVFASLLSLTGCLFGYHLTWDSGLSVAAIGKGGFEVKNAYYCFGSTEGDWGQAQVMVQQDVTGVEPTGDVIWSCSPQELGQFIDESLPPSRRIFIARDNVNTTLEGVVAAEFEGEIASSRVVIYPQIKLPAGQNLDINGDGTNDIEFSGQKVTFLHGARSYDFLFDADAFAAVPSDVEAAPAGSYEYVIPSHLPTNYFVFKGSDGAVYLGRVWPGYNLSYMRFGWRKLRDAA